MSITRFKKDAIAKRNQPCLLILCAITRARSFERQLTKTTNNGGKTQKSKNLKNSIRFCKSRNISVPVQDLALTSDSSAMSLSKELEQRMLDETTECSVLLGSSTSGNFDRVIVYLRRHDFEDGSYTNLKGMFRVVNMTNVIVDKPLNDFKLDTEMFQNRHGTSVRPVSIKWQENTYLRAALFARIRVKAQTVWLNAIVRKLNSQLEKYQDDLRDAIAYEWCSQEHWRIFPMKAGHMYPVHYQEENVQILRGIMKDFLPKGYDADWTM